MDDKEKDVLQNKPPMPNAPAQQGQNNPGETGLAENQGKTPVGSATGAAEQNVFTSVRETAAVPPQNTVPHMPGVGTVAAGQQPQGFMPGAYPYPMYNRPVPKPKEPFSATKTDTWFAIACFGFGFLFMRWLMFAGFWGWGVTAFTVLFAGGALVFARGKKVTPSKESWFWLAVLLATATTFGLWPGQSMAGWRIFLLLAAAVYWCISLMGGLLAGKTSNFLPLDFINTTLLVPFLNYTVIGRALKRLAQPGKEKSKGPRTGLKVLVGVLVCIPLFAIVVPQLLAADFGRFAQLTDEIARLLENIVLDDVGVYLLQALLGIPVALYLFGLLAGAAHKRYVRGFDLKKTKQSLETLRFVPVATVATVLCVLSALYIVFIACQVPDYFSAFAGTMPAEYGQVSQYAREGFFELCRIAAINMAVLVVCGCISRKGQRGPGVQRGLTILVSVLTLLLIATAFSKMALYISWHGLTPKRIMTCVFMVFMAGVFVAAIVLQFKKFSIVRFGAILGAALLCGMCLCNIDARLMEYNTGRFINGTLPNYEPVIVQWTGANGYGPAVQAYNSGKLTAEQQEEILQILHAVSEQAQEVQGTSRDTLAHGRVRGAAPLPALPEGMVGYGES